MTEQDMRRWSSSVRIGSPVRNVIYPLSWALVYEREGSSDGNLEYQWRELQETLEREMV